MADNICVFIPIILMFYLILVHTAFCENNITPIFMDE